MKKYEIELEFVEGGVPVKFKLECLERPTTDQILKICDFNEIHNVSIIYIKELLELCLPTPTW